MPTATKTRAVSELILNALELVDVTLQGSSTRVYIPPSMIIPNQTTVKRTNQIEHLVIEDGKHLVCLFTSIFTGVPIDADQNKTAEPKFQIAAAFAMVFKITGNKKFNEKDIEAFCEINGENLVAPYMREFVQSSCVRMGIPVYTVPLVRPTPRKTKK